MNTLADISNRVRTVHEKTDQTESVIWHHLNLPI